VVGGTYNRTYANDGTGPTGEADPADIADFRLDKYLVTVGRFRKFVAAWNDGGGYEPVAGSGKHEHLNGGRGLVNSGGSGFEPGWSKQDTSGVQPTDANLACGGTWTPAATSADNLPITCVTWFEAYAFCIWDGGFLPSEAEWEYAAAGGARELAFPWGSEAPGTNDQYAVYDSDYGGGTAAPVGTAASGAGSFGQLDLAGNAWEWNLDWFAAYTSCTNCADTSPAAYRAIRGGAFDVPASLLTPPTRGTGIPSTRNGHFGVRCARVP
jgi:formylglycine-generating enzyme required for sulfatase activity